jgi:membrane protein
MDSDGAVMTRRVRLWRTIRELVREAIDDNATDAAASVAFWLLLSLPAMLLAGLAALSLLGDEATNELRRVTLEFVDRVFTSEADELRSAVDGLFDQNKAGLFSVTIVLALVTASRGFAGLIRALDVVYDIEEPRSFLRLRLAALGLALGTIATISASTYLWWLSGVAGIPLMVRVFGALGILVVWAATIFHIGPAHHTPWRYDLPGAVVVAVGWFSASVCYGWYIRIAGGGGNEIVGLAGALLLGMTWFWIVCLVLLIGGELNEIVARRAGVVAEQSQLLGGVLPQYSARQMLTRWRSKRDDN